MFDPMMWSARWVRRPLARKSTTTRDRRPFRHTDISLPGNDDLPMSVGRRYTVEGTGAYGGGASKFGGGLFGDWSIHLPVIHGTFAKWCARSPWLQGES